MMLTKTEACCCDLLQIARAHSKEEAKRVTRTLIDEFFDQLRDFEKKAKRNGRADCRAWAHKLQDHIRYRLLNSDRVRLMVLNDCINYVGERIRGM